MTLADLEALRPIIKQMGAAPGYNWLTPEWIQERIKVLGPAPNHPRLQSKRMPESSSLLNEEGGA